LMLLVCRDDSPENDDEILSISKEIAQLHLSCTSPVSSWICTEPDSARTGESENTLCRASRSDRDFALAVALLEMT
jgi:hypothetical protein